MLCVVRQKQHPRHFCKTLMAQTEKLKGGGDSSKNNKSTDKSWKNKANDDADDSKKELAVSIKKATHSIKKNKLNAVNLEKKVEPVKKRNVNWPIKEDKQQRELCALDVKLKEFN